MVFKTIARKNWLDSLIVYHIYPLSFMDSDGDGYGDLNGIIEKLDYLSGHKKSLNVDAVWLSAIQTSPMKDFGYDVTDYYSIDPIFGDLTTFKKLIEECHSRKLKFILDFVPNHTSNLHSWFKQSQLSKNNPKRNWYVWKDPSNNGGPPNNWVSDFGGSAWTYDKKTGQYYLHSFLPEQPDLNWRNKEVVKEMEKVLHFWLKIGVDGFRIDSVNYLKKDPLFRNDPINKKYDPQQNDPYDRFIHKNSEGNSDLLKTINRFCKILKKYKNKFMISEVYLDINSMKKLYNACPEKIHIPLNPNLINIPWKAHLYKDFIDEFEKSLTKNDIPNYSLGNHDWSRLSSRIGSQNIRVAAMMLLTLRGIAFIYQGEEIGMVDGIVPADRVKDPLGNETDTNREGRDRARTPMHWKNKKNAGFSRNEETWLPISSSYKKINIKDQEKDPRSVLNLYKTLIKYKKNLVALKEGSYESIDSKDRELFIYARKKKDKEVIIALNFSNKEKNINIRNSEAKILCSTYMDKKDLLTDLKNVPLRQNEGCIFKVIRNN